MASTDDQVFTVVHNGRKRRFTKKELLHSLKILGPITNPLPATLPPSPPASRSSSPAPTPLPSATPIRSAKRKHDASDPPPSPPASLGSASASSSSAARKRIRTNHTSPAASASELPPTPPAEDPFDHGPQRPPSDSSSSSSSSSAQSTFPVKRPRRGRKPEGGDYRMINLRYTHDGTRFKRSSEARLGVYARPESNMFCQMLKRPSHGTPYAKYDRLMSKFEALDSVLCFAYSQWYKEYHGNKCEYDWWKNSSSFFDLCERTHMEAFPNAGPKEEALHGIYNLIDGYWRAKHAWHFTRYYLLNQTTSILVEHQKSPATTKSSPSSDGSTRSPNVAGQGAVQLQPTPPSTGLSPAGAIAPAATASLGASASTSSNLSSSSSRSTPQSRSVAYPEPLARTVQQATKLHISSSEALFLASQRITLSILETHFPNTFARVTKSSLRDDEEYEIDFEDDESELFWPSPGRGLGLGWACALGRSMLREYAKEYGYEGIEGAAKPEDIIFPNRKDRPHPQHQHHHRS